MIKNNIYILYLVFICLCTSCKAQEIKIVVDDKGNGISKENLEVFSVMGKDTITLKSIKPKYYELKSKGKEMTLLIIYRSKSFSIKNVNNRVKSFFIDYEQDAKNDCYTINRMYSDAIQSSNASNLNNCTSIVNIYLYDNYDPDRNNTPSVKLRKKK